MTVPTRTAVAGETSEVAKTSDVWFYLVMGLVLLLCRWLASQVLPVYDDAFITLRYARNLAAGHGLVYQPGEWVLGTTAPGFALFNSLFFPLRLPMPQTTQALNALLEVGTVYLILWALPPAKRLTLGLCLAVVLGVNPMLARISVGGMEMMAFLAVSLAACVLFLRGAKPAAYLLAVLAYLLRPEALILWAVLLFLDIIPQRVRALREVFRSTLPAILVFGLILLVTYRLYGQLVPQSVIAKSQLAKPPLAEVLRLFLAPDVVTLVLWPLAVVGFVMTARTHGLTRILGLWTFGYTLLYALFRPQIWSWYGAPAYFTVTLLAAWVGAAVIDRFGWLTRLVQTRRTRLAVLCLPIVVWVGVWRVVGPSGVTQHIYTPLAEWCATSIQPGQSIMAYDIGAVGYYCDGRIYDLAGLVWPEANVISSVDAAIETYRPDFLLITAVRRNITWLGQPALTSTYRPLARFSRRGDTDLTLTPDRFPTEWTQDYILLQRIQ